MTTLQTPLLGAAVLTSGTSPSVGQVNVYNASSGSISATLPALSGLNVGARMSVAKYSGDSSANTVTFTRSGTDAFQNPSTTTVVLKLPGEQVTLQVVSVSGTKYWSVLSGVTPLTALDGRFAAIGSATPTGMLVPVQHHCDGTETFTIASGSVTTIAGNTTGITIQWQTVSVGDRILVMSAPAATGVGSGYTFTLQPANGIYVVTAVNANTLSVARSSDLSGSVNPTGLTVFSENKNAGWGSQGVYTVVEPYTAASFTYGSTSMKWASVGGKNLNATSIYVGNGQIGFYNGGTYLSTYLKANTGATGGSNQQLTLPGVLTGTLVAKVVTAISSTVTLDSAPGTEYVYLLGSGAVPTLPTAVGNTAFYTIKNTTSGAITLSSVAGTIDGAANLAIQPGASVSLVSNGTNYILSGTGNVMSTISNTGVLTLPTTTDTLVGRATTDSLTNKTLTNPTVTNYTESVVAIGTVTTSNTLSLTNGTMQTATLTASTACTFTMPTATAGKSFVLMLKQAASTGNGSATFTGVKWGSSGAPTITAAAGKMDILSFFSDGTNWYGSASQGYTP